MKIKCFRFPWEVCGNDKVVSSIQVFFRKTGEVSYARARHYGDKKFYYHQQSKDYIKNKLDQLNLIDHDQSYALKLNFIAIQNNLELSSKSVINVNMARDVRFIPTFKFHTKTILKSEPYRTYPRTGLSPYWLFSNYLAGRGS